MARRCFLFPVWGGGLGGSIEVAAFCPPSSLFSFPCPLPPLPPPFPSHFIAFPVMSRSFQPLRLPLTPHTSSAAGKKMP